MAAALFAGCFPRPLGLGARPFAADFLAPLFSLAARGGLTACFRRAFPAGVFAPAVFRLPPRLTAAARRPAPFFLAEGLSFSPLLFPLVFAIAVFSFLRRVLPWPGLGSGSFD
jgi:hypothetical protein